MLKINNINKEIEMHEQKVISLLEYITIDKSNITCHFKCSNTNKTISSTVPFEPYEGKIKFTWREILFHPIESYNRYYHTPITIFSEKYKGTLVKKAFLKVSRYFKWDVTTQNYVCI